MPSTDLIEAYLQHLLELGRSDYTIRARRGILGRMDNQLPEGLDGATDEELRKWIHIPGRKPQSRATYLSACHDFYAFCTNPRIGPYLDYDPSASLIRPKVPIGIPRPVSDEQLKTILQRAQGQYKIWSLAAAYEGTRCIEISRLDREHIDEKRTLLHGKGNKIAYVVTHPVFWEAVVDLPDGPLARRPDGERADPHFVSSRASLYFKSLGLRGVTLHRMRHWYGTKMQETTGDIRVTQAALRHSSVTSTQVYTLVAQNRVEDAVHQLPRLTEDPPSAGSGAGDAA